MSDRKSDTGRRSTFARILETSPFPILLVSLVGIVLLSVFAPSIVVGDTWLTLMAGREVVDHGLPDTEHLTVLGDGRTWTDQQWLAQVLFYAAHGLAGMRAVILLGVALVLLALGARDRDRARRAARRRARPSSSAVLAVLAGPWGWTLRAQTAALPLFAGVLWLLVDASRRGARRRTLLVLPLLVLWANLHGSVVLGAGLTCSSGSSSWCAHAGSRGSRSRSSPSRPLTVLASPYGTKLIAYYDLMLVDAPFAPILREWQWSSPSATTALFWLLALVAVGLLAMRRCRSRLTFYELAVLLVTFVGAVQAVRGVIWFALAAAAILPLALDGVLTKADVDAPRSTASSRSRRSRASPSQCSRSSHAPRRGSSRSGRSSASRRCAQATRDPNARLWATDGTADWLLWRIPDLRGRIAYDVRFELYDGPALDRIVDYGRGYGGWRAHCRRLRGRDRRRPGTPRGPRARARSARRLPRR